MQQFIVAEISKNWERCMVAGDQMPPYSLISREFEGVIEVNRRRGYRLHSFQLHRLMTDKDRMNETIIAVFELDPKLQKGA